MVEMVCLGIRSEEEISEGRERALVDIATAEDVVAPSMTRPSRRRRARRRSNSQRCSRIVGRLSIQAIMQDYISDQ